MGEFDELIKAINESRGATEALVAEFKQKKANEAEAELPALEKSLQDAIAAMQTKHDDQILELKTQFENAMAAHKATSEKTDPEYASLGHWMAKAFRGEIERKDFGEATGAVGGYMVPDQFLPQIMKIPMEQAVVRPRATVLPMASDTAKIPALNADSHATNFFGGMLGYWLTEAQAITASSWTAKEVALAVNTLAAAGKISKQLINDSPLAMSNVIATSFGEILTFMEDQAFFDGNGSGKPQGVIGAGCEIAVTRSSATDVTFTDIVTMESKFLGKDDRAVYCANRDIIPKLYAIKDAGNNQLFIPNVAPGAPATLFGKPIIFTEKCSALGTKGDLILADWSYYVIGDRQEVIVDWSDHVAFLNIQSVVRLYERIDGKPWMDTTYTPRKGTAKSPFVILN